MSAACSGPGPGATGMRRGCRLRTPGNQAHASPALLTFSVHSSCCENRRQCRLAANSATVLTNSPAIVAPADSLAADLSPRQGAGKGSAHNAANWEPWALSSARWASRFGRELVWLRRRAGRLGAVCRAIESRTALGPGGSRPRRSSGQSNSLQLKRQTGAGTRPPSNHCWPIGCIHAPFNFSQDISK